MENVLSPYIQGKIAHDVRCAMRAGDRLFTFSRDRSDVWSLAGTSIRHIHQLQLPEFVISNPRDDIVYDEVRDIIVAYSGEIYVLDATDGHTIRVFDEPFDGLGFRLSPSYSDGLILSFLDDNVIDENGHCQSVAGHHIRIHNLLDKSTPTSILSYLSHHTEKGWEKTQVTIFG
ncbi:hypothetical protein C8J56DRAFT_1052995 [Mycena floridula]|nr:hypothetical protein C8J56DRAFT_1052995 [Mycena floridula]